MTVEIIIIICGIILLGFAFRLMFPTYQERPRTARNYNGSSYESARTRKYNRYG